MKNDNKKKVIEEKPAVPILREDIQGKAGGESVVVHLDLSGLCTRILHNFCI